MKKLILFFITLIPSFVANAQFTHNPFGDFSRKKIYNYASAEIFLNQPEGQNESQAIYGLRYSVCFTNGKYHQFGIGSGFISHNAAAGNARVNYTGIPIYITNRFYLSDVEDKQVALYLEAHFGYHLPLGGTYQSGTMEGQPVPPFLPKGTGFFGFTFGARVPIVNNTGFTMEFIFRDQHVPYPGKENFYPYFVGLGCGYSF